MMSSQALIPQAISQIQFKVASEVLAFASGLGLLIALSQLVLPLPWTPVPITGQTLGVSLLSLSWGRKRGLGIFICYLALGLLGWHVFAAGGSGIPLGPTAGYLFGMAIASFVEGGLSDRGFCRSFFSSVLASVAGSAVIFACGLLWLSQFVPTTQLLTAGLLPFLPGDAIKTLFAATLSWQLRRTVD